MSQRIRPLDEPVTREVGPRIPMALTRAETLCVLAALDARCATCNTALGPRAKASLKTELGDVVRDLTRMARRRGWLGD